MKFLKDLKKEDLQGKTALVRVDFNVEDSGSGLRLEAVVPSLDCLLKNGCRVVILSHRGRPEEQKAGKEKKDFSLRQFVHFLEEHIGKVKFLEDIPEKLPAGDAFLLENLRFWKGEPENSPEFAKRLAALGDLFVNDAFAVAHRKNASVVQLPKLMPAYAGFLMEKEIATLGQVMKNPKQPLVLIFGGNKTVDKIDTIKNLLPQAERVLMGSNAINESELFPSSQKILRPTDWVPAEGKAMDIGAGTIRRYVAEIKKAGTIVWNGPLGKFEDKEYCLGSMAIAKAVAESGAFTVVGGGETTHLINLLGLEKKISFLSTGGGAMLEFLAGKKLPGIVALG